MKVVSFELLLSRLDECNQSSLPGGKGAVLGGLFGAAVTGAFASMRPRVWQNLPASVKVCLAVSSFGAPSFRNRMLCAGCGYRNGHARWFCALGRAFDNQRHQSRSQRAFATDSRSGVKAIRLSEICQRSSVSDVGCRWRTIGWCNWLSRYKVRSRFVDENQPPRIRSGIGGGKLSIALLHTRIVGQVRRYTFQTHSLVLQISVVALLGRVCR
jgi:hypothetical protein